jgi:hypothetical protein
MRTYAQNHQRFQQGKSTDPARPGAAARSHEVHPILHLQRKVGNRAVQRLLRAKSDGLEAASDATAIGRSGDDFSRIPLQAKALVMIQSKPSVHTPGDLYQKEADRASEQVMRMSEPQQQRACACGGGCPTCQHHNEQSAHQHLQVKRVQTSDSGEMVAPPIVNEVLSQTGQPLDEPTRAFAERRLGHSFEHARVHMDERAAASAEAVEARAYTVGNHIVFGGGEFQPHVQEGQRLLLHELVHTIQMRRGGMGNRIARTPRNGCTPQRMHVADPDAIMVQQISQVARQVEYAILLLRHRFGGIWWMDQAEQQQERDRIDFFFNCPTEARVQEIIADLERLRAILEPSFPYRCELHLLPVFTLHNRPTPNGPVPAGMNVSSSHFHNLDFLRLNILAVGLRLIGFSFEGKIPYLRYVRREAPGAPTCRPTPPATSAGGQRTTQNDYVTRNDPELTRDTVIVVSTENGVVVQWDAEPRRLSARDVQERWRFHGRGGYHPEALQTPYEWHADESTGRVFIMVNGQRVNLLRQGRVEIQR